jgi:hypothetical protein
MQRCLLRNHLGTPYSTSRDWLENATELTERLGDDVGNLLNISFGELAGALAGVDLGNAEGEESKSATDTLDNAETEGGLALTINVGVLHTQNVRKIVCVLKNES